jgi:hypothetical protein
MYLYKNTTQMTKMESLISAEEDIKSYLGLFKECYEKAIEKYNRLLDFFKDPMYNRTKAINFQNIIVNQIKDTFSEIPETEIIEKYESISLLIKGYIAARFKKFNGKGFPSNHRSGRNDAIIAQQLEIGYKEYPPIARIDIGYTWNATGTDYEFLKVICRKDDDVLWDLFFHETDSSDNSSKVIQQNHVTPPNNSPSRVTANKQHKKAE